MQLRRAALPAAVLLTTLAVLPASALVAPQWDTLRDAGQLADDRSRFVVASPRLDRVNQGVDTVVVAGETFANTAESTARVNDRDVTATAYNAVTGAVRWTSPLEPADVNVDSQLAGFGINEHNNNLYEVVNRSGNVLYRERGVSNGQLGSAQATIAGATAKGAAIGNGSFIGIVGSQGGNALVTVYQSGFPTLEFTSTPVPGTANAADIPVDSAPVSFGLGYERTILATGTTTGFGNPGDVWTAAYNFRTHALLWQRTWASPDNRLDAGVAAEIGWVNALPAGRQDVGFVAAKTFSPVTGWDIVVTAYDLSTGLDVWSQVVRFNGTSGKDDLPVDLEFSRATGTLYVTGSSDRAPTQDQDVIVLALDGATGAQQAVAYAGGVTNGNDAPTQLIVTPDGQRVFVSADLAYSTAANGAQSALLAYDAALLPYGRPEVGAAGSDFSAGVALNSTADRVFLGSSSPVTGSGLDHRATSYGIAAFAPDVEPVVPEVPFAALLPLLAIAAAATVVVRRRRPVAA